MGHLHNGVLVSRKKEGNFLTIQMDMESIMLSEMGQSEKDKYHMILLIYGI